MNPLTPVRIFEDNGSVTRECENFTYMQFVNFRQSEMTAPVSFFRSDFRGSKFAHCSFWRNNFDRADIISCVFENCQFTNVHIGASEMKNCYFKDVIFKNNNYNHTSIQESTFENCEFTDEHLIVNMKNCRLINCKLSNCSFERSTVESVSFLECKIYSSDLATMHAERLEFEKCTIQDSSMGISYIFGYLFYQTDLSGIKILYRGVELPFTKETINSHAERLWEERRFCEFLNASIICGNFNFVPEIVTKSLENLLQESPYLREIELDGIFKILKFYTLNNVFPFPVFCQIVENLESFEWKKLTTEERIKYISNCEMLKFLIQDGEYNAEFISSAHDCQSILTIHCNTDDYEAAKESAYKFLESLSDRLNISGGFTLLDTKKGSWVFIFLVVSSIALLIPKVIAETINVSLEISTKRQIRKLLEPKLKQKNMSINDLKTITEIVSNSGLIKGSSMQIEPSKLIDALKIYL